jgi:murein DD-endopeptidase MepM/ murein hydrolase activator NlpD
MKKKLFSKLFAFLLTAVLLFPFLKPITANAGSKEDYAAAQEKLDEINREISSIKNQQLKKSTAKKNAEKQAKLIKTQIAILNNRISRANTKLREKQEELEVKKEDLEATDQLFKSRLKALYVTRTSGSLSVILGVDSFSQLMTSTDALRRISAADTDLLKKIKSEMDEIKEEEERIKAQLDDLNSKQEAMNSKQKELAGILQTIDSSLTDLQRQEKAASETQAEVYAEYIAAKNAVEAEFGKEYTDGDYVGGEYIWPVPSNGNISSGYGYRVLFGMRDFHTGIDISSAGGPYIMGKPIVAANSGTVVKAVYSNRGYGNYLIIDHGGGNMTLYGHCSSLAVTTGAYVTQGQTIAYVGSTGNSTGPHLHFEIRVNGKTQNPENYNLAGRPFVSYND